MAYPYYAAQKRMSEIYIYWCGNILKDNKVICLTIKLQKNIYRIIPNWPKRKTKPLYKNIGITHTFTMSLHVVCQYAYKCIENVCKNTYQISYGDFFWEQFKSSNTVFFILFTSACFCFLKMKEAHTSKLNVCIILMQMILKSIFSTDFSHEL